jgi:hypothetical protein
LDELNTSPIFLTPNHWPLTINGFRWRLKTFINPVDLTIGHRPLEISLATKHFVYPANLTIGHRRFPLANSNT